MPFVSDAQRRYMYAKHPDIAARWQKETPKGKLPEYHHAKSKAKSRMNTYKSKNLLHYKNSEYIVTTFILYIFST